MADWDERIKLKESGQLGRSISNGPLSQLTYLFNKIYNVTEHFENAINPAGEFDAEIVSGFDTEQMTDMAIGVNSARKVRITSLNPLEPTVLRKVKFRTIKGANDRTGIGYTSQLGDPLDPKLTPKQKHDLLTLFPWCYSENQDVAMIPIKTGDIVKIYRRNGAYFYRASANRGMLGDIKEKLSVLADSAMSHFSTPNAGGPHNVMGVNPNQDPVLTVAQAGDIHRGTGLPCCSFVACWVLNQLGMAPSFDQYRNWKAWRDIDQSLWAKINLIGFPVGSYANLATIKGLLGGFLSYYSSLSSGGVPKLTPGRWHVVQNWKPDASGHTYLIYYAGGKTARVVQSSRKHHFRDETKQVSKAFSKEASTFGVLTLGIGGASPGSDEVPSAGGEILDSQEKNPAENQEPDMSNVPGLEDPWVE